MSEGEFDIVAALDRHKRFAVLEAHAATDDQAADIVAHVRALEAEVARLRGVAGTRLSEEERAFLAAQDRAAAREGVAYAEWFRARAIIDRLSVPPVAPEVEKQRWNDETEFADEYRARLIAGGVLRAPDGEAKGGE